MSVSISGILLDPFGQPASFAEVKFITWQGANDVLTTAPAVFKTSADGAYSFAVEFATYTVQVRYNQSNGKFQTIKQKVIVNSSASASTLGELLLFNEPLTPPEIAYVEQLVAEAEGYRDEAEGFAQASESSSQTSEGFSQASSGYADDANQSAIDAANSAALIAPVPLNGGVWASGQTYKAYNEYMIYNGEAYSPFPATVLPYTVGSAPDLGFVYQIKLNDHSLLANRGVAGAHDEIYDRSFANVSDMIAYTGHVVGLKYSTGGTVWEVDTISVTMSLSDFAAKTDVIANDFELDNTGATDNTSKYDFIVSNLRGGELIRWLDGEYVGNFVSESKSFTLDLGGAVHINSDDSEAIIRFGEKSPSEYNVTEIELLTYGNTFTVTGASGLFSVGDIGYLWDGAVRPTGGSVNFETVKIGSIVGDVITIVGFFASYKGAGAIKFFHSANQLKDVVVNGGKFKPTDAHTGLGLTVWNTEGVEVNGQESENTTGQAVSIRYSYNVTATDITPRLPFAVGSGQGYGLHLFGVNHFYVRTVRGQGCRHAFDADSSYFGKVLDITDMDAKGTPCILAHNGFAGFIDCDTVRCLSDQYPVSLSEQGYGGTPNAERGNHAFRSVHVRNVDNVVAEAITPDSFNVQGVYFQNSVIDCSVDTVNIKHRNQDPLTTASQSNVIRVNGIMKGVCDFKNISTDKCANILFSNGDRGTLDAAGVKAKLTNVVADRCRRIALVQGAQSLIVDTADVGTESLENELILMQDISGDNPVAISYSGITYPASEVKPIVNTDGFSLEGDVPKSGRNSKTNVVLTGSGSEVLSESDIQNKGKSVRLVSPVGAGTMNMTLSAPSVEGQELNLYKGSGGRLDIVFDTGTTLDLSFTLTPSTGASLVAVNGVWSLQSVVSFP